MDWIYRELRIDAIKMWTSVFFGIVAGICCIYCLHKNLNNIWLFVTTFGLSIYITCTTSAKSKQFLAMLSYVVEHKDDEDLEAKCSYKCANIHMLARAIDVTYSIQIGALIVGLFFTFLI